MKKLDYKLLPFIALLFSMNLTAQKYFYSTSSSSYATRDISHLGTLTLGSKFESLERDRWHIPGVTLLDLYKTSGNVNMRIGNDLGKINFSIAGNNGAFHPLAIPGDVIFSKQGAKNVYFNLNNTGNNGMDSFVFGDALNHHTLTIKNNGKVTIGTNNFDTDSNYKLYVKDGIKTERIKVEVASENGWADYVFEENYNLTSLENLEKYIKVNKHLPEVPTTQEVLKNGVELKAMNILLLKKIEELTLYTIQQQNTIEEIKEALKNMKK